MLLGSIQHFGVNGVNMGFSDEVFKSYGAKKFRNFRIKAGDCVDLKTFEKLQKTGMTSRQSFSIQSIQNILFFILIVFSIL